MSLTEFERILRFQISFRGLWTLGKHHLSWKPSETFSRHWIHRRSKLTKSREPLPNQLMLAWASGPSNITLCSKRGQFRKTKKTMHSWVMREKTARKRTWTSRRLKHSQLFQVLKWGWMRARRCHWERSICLTGILLVPWQWGWRSLWARPSSPPRCTWSQPCCHIRTRHRTPGGHCPPSDSRAPSSRPWSPWCWTCQLPLEKRRL